MNMKKRAANEQREFIFARDCWICQSCGRPAREGQAQLAHVISKSRFNLVKYGDEVINHPFNLKTACSLECNSRLANGQDLVEEMRLVSAIREDLGYEDA